MFLPRGYIPGKTLIDELIDGTTLFTQLNVDNIRVDSNTISSINTNGDITYLPNGTGKNVFAKTINLSSGNFQIGGVDTINSNREANLNKCNTPEISSILTTYQYQFTYDWSVLPTSSAFPWTKNTSGSGYSESVADGVLSISSNSSGTQWYSRETSNIATTDTVIVEHKCSLTSNDSAGLIIASIRDGTNNASLTAASTTSLLYLNGTSIKAVDFSTPHVFRLEKVSTEKINVYVDNVLAYTTSSFASLASQGLYWGDVTTGSTTSMSSYYFKYSIIKEGSRNIVGTSAQVDNINIDGNSITSTNTNGDINITPNGTGSVIIPKLTVSPLTITDNSTYVRLLNSGCLDFYDNGYILIASAGSQKIKLQSSGGVGVDVQGSIYPTVDNTYSLGASGYRWTEIWATNGTIQTSDARNKTEILTSDLGLNFVNQLQPVSFRWNDGKRRHYGIIAQDVESSLDGKDFAGFIKDVQTGEYGLRYHEFLCPMIKAIQELNEKVEKYENTRLFNMLKRFILTLVQKIKINFV